GARFGSADLTDADLTNAIGIESDIDQAILCRTRLPWGDIDRDCS
ncbi:MAG: pentapeptide repeat-containing protein, partial [Acidiferrobacteraceae bacterium]|nr:pentapeptide repeat-containing protein [Acidiferrobacteraceae bacterium]